MYVNVVVVDGKQLHSPVTTSHLHHSLDLPSSVLSMNVHGEGGPQWFRILPLISMTVGGFL